MLITSTLECEPQPGSVSDEPRALAFMDGTSNTLLAYVPVLIKQEDASAV
jgi:hypothetical protein